MLVAAMEHAILHCARFIYAKEAFLIWSTDTGRSGLIGCLLLLPIVLPMKFEFFRTKVCIGIHVCADTARDLVLHRSLGSNS